MSDRSPRTLSALLLAAVFLAACSSSDSGQDAVDSAAAGIAEQVVDSATPIPDAVVESTVPPTAPPTTQAPVDDDPVEEPPATDTATTTTQSRPAVDGAALTWGVLETDFNTGLDPVEALDFGTYAVLAQVVEHLVVSDGAGGVTPALAAEWSANEDSTVWTFQLRDDVTFHDGTPFTAADVRYSLERAIDFGTPGFSDAVDPGGVEIVDDLTVRVNTNTPTVDLPILVSTAAPQTAIVFEGGVFDDFLIGTGPFQLVEYDQFSAASFEANPSWWNGEPTLARLDFAFFTSSARAAAALRAGEIDGIAQADPLDLESLADDPDIAVATAAANNHRQIWMRTDTGPFEDVRVRQAFALSIDRQAIVDAILPGLGRVANDHPFATTWPGFDTTVAQRTKDDEAARALLADAGFPDGLEVTLFVGDLAEIPDLASLIANQAASAGFTITPEVVPNSSFYGAHWCPDFNEERCNGESFGVVDYGHRPTPSVYLGPPLETGGVWNASNHADPTYDALLDRYENAPDAAAAAAATGEIQRYLHDQVPVVIPYFFDLPFAHASRISGVSHSALGQPSLAFATVS